MATHVYWIGDWEIIRDSLIVKGLKSNRSDYWITWIQLVTVEEIKGITEGWHPLPQIHLFPCCPQVGDNFKMTSYYCDREGNSPPNGCGNICWRVMARHIEPVANTCPNLGGTIKLLVESEIGSGDTIFERFCRRANSHRKCNNG